MKIKKRIINIFLYMILVAVLIAVALPLVYTVASSFKTNAEILVNPERIFSAHPTFDNYRAAWTSPDFNVGRLLWNSTWYTILNVLITVSASCMCGYVFARGRFPLKKVIFTCFTALMFIKTGGIGIYATFQLLNLVHLRQSLWALLTVHLFGIPIVNIYLVKGYISSLPSALDEAAKIDGAGEWKIFSRIYMPLCKGAIVSVALLVFIDYWNMVEQPLIMLSDTDKHPLGVFLAQINTGETGLAFAVASIYMIPCILLFLYCEEYIALGITYQGGLKS